METTYELYRESDILLEESVKTGRWYYSDNHASRFEVCPISYSGQDGEIESCEINERGEVIITFSGGRTEELEFFGEDATWVRNVESEIEDDSYYDRETGTWI